MEYECREFVPTKKARDSSQALYKELLDSLYPQYLKELRSLTTLYIRGWLSPEEKENILPRIDSIEKAYPQKKEVIESMGYFAWMRYSQEKNPEFLVSVAGQVQELTPYKTKWESMLRDDFYNHLYEAFCSWHEHIGSYDRIERVIQILWDDFREYLHKNLKQDKRLTDVDRTNIRLSYREISHKRAQY